jgi:hypothetical protein
MLTLHPETARHITRTQAHRKLFFTGIFKKFTCLLKDGMRMFLLRIIADKCRFEHTYSLSDSSAILQKHPSEKTT